MLKLIWLLNLLKFQIYALVNDDHFL